MSAPSGPVRLELQESSGPVSPRFQYALHLTLEASPQAIRLQREIRAGAASPMGPSRSDTLEIPADRFEALWRDLEAHDAVRQGADLIGDSGRRRVGVSFNHFILEVAGQPTVRVDYLLPQLEDDAHAPLRAIVEAFKRFAAGV